MEITEEQIEQGLDKAYEKAGNNAYFGNGSWGRIDFLTNYKRFRVVRVSDFKGIRY